MDNYLEEAKKYLARKESKKIGVLNKICKVDYTNIDSRWDDNNKKK